LDLTIGDEKNRLGRKEIAGLREALVGYFMYDNCYGLSDEGWEKYFY